MAALLNFIRVLRANGGLWRSLYNLGLHDDLKAGRLVGEDEFGNKYYENDKYFLGKNRWVRYADYYGFEYDPSQVTPKWSGWLHYRTDLPPNEDPSRPHYHWMSHPQENLTGTKEEYVPWSTTRPKIHAWRPSKSSAFKSRDCSQNLRLSPCGDKKPDKGNPKSNPCEKPTNAFH